VIGLLSGTVTASARSLGHVISFYVTGGMMLGLVAFFAHGAVAGNRRHAPTRCLRFGPLAVLVCAAVLIMVEPTRHLIGDKEIWPWCGNNPAFDRINSTDAFPAQCMSSNTQYVCTEPCCVPTWQPTDPADPKSGYSWTPQTNAFFPDGPVPGPFGTLRPDGSVFFPPHFDRSAQPLTVYEASAGAPLVFYETGAVNPLRRNNPAQGCKYGLNNATGYCLLDEDNLPLADPKAPYNATTNPHVCRCDSCTPVEDMAHLSVVGVFSTIVITYLGFALMVVAVGWNANLLSKLSAVRRQWDDLRGHSARVRAGEPSGSGVPLRTA